MSQIATRPVDGAVFGPAFAGRVITGYAADGLPVPRQIPYMFRGELLAALTFAWSRELARKEDRARMGVLLVGPKGAGKTTLVEQFFARLGVPVWHYTASRATELPDLLESRTLIDGSIVPVEGPLLAAMRHGCPFVLNEIDLLDPGALTGLNDVIERGVAHTSTGLVVAKQGFLLIATANGIGDETGEYAGTNRMNAALISRFGVRLRVGWPSAQEETEILAMTTGIGKALAGKLVKVACDLRAGEAMSAPPSTRELLAWAELTHAFATAGMPKPVAQAADVAIGNALEPAEQEALRRAIHAVLPEA